MSQQRAGKKKNATFDKTWRVGSGRRSAFQTVAFDLAVEGGALDAEDGGSLALVPVGVLQGAEDVALLNLVERQGFVRRLGAGRPDGGGSDLERGQPDVAHVEHG